MIRLSKRDHVLRPTMEGPEAEPDRTRLWDAIAGLGPFIDERVALPFNGALFVVTRPSDTDALLDRVADDPEQQLPYWSELWPSGIALADAIAGQPEVVRGQRVLELGSGLGVTATAALQAEALLTVTDYAPEALALCQWNTWRNAGREPETMAMNWRQPPAALFDLAGSGYPVVLAADVLYERRDIAPLVALIERLIAPAGLLWLAEPSRPVAATFLDEMSTGGWDGQTITRTGPWPDDKDADVVVRVHQLRRR